MFNKLRWRRLKLWWLGFYHSDDFSPVSAVCLSIVVIVLLFAATYDQHKTIQIQREVIDKQWEVIHLYEDREHSLIRYCEGQYTEL